MGALRVTDPCLSMSGSIVEVASGKRIELLLGRLGEGLARGGVLAAPATALIVTKLQGCNANLDEVQRLSAAFLGDRARTMKGVLGARVLSMADADFVYFPIVDPCACSFIH